MAYRAAGPNGHGRDKNPNPDPLKSADVHGITADRSNLHPDMPSTLVGPRETVNSPPHRSSTTPPLAQSGRVPKMSGFQLPGSGARLSRRVTVGDEY